MSGQLNFGAFLNGALSGFETGMDLREKGEIYKQRRRDRGDKNATQDAMVAEAEGQQLRDQMAATGAEKVVAPAAPLVAPPAAKLGVGVYDESMYGTDTPLAPTAALKRGAGLQAPTYWQGMYDDPSIQRFR